MRSVANPEHVLQRRVAEISILVTALRIRSTSFAAPAERFGRCEKPIFSRPAAAFTVIELLVVVGIIVLLAGLLLPVLTRSKRSAQVVKCAVQLHQLGLAAQMYWDDNAGNAFRWRGANTNNGQVYWFGWMETGNEGERRFDLMQGALYPYLSGRGVEVCPAFNYLSPRLKLKATGASYGYGYNLSLSAPLTDPPVRVSQITRPSELALLADAAQVNTFQAPASPEHPMIEEFYYVSTNEATVHFRHQRMANVVFCDGHAAREKSSPGSLDRRLANEVIGRLRDEILVIW